MRALGFIFVMPTVIYLIVLEVLYFTDWWGGFGLFAALIFSPLISAIFPFLLWAKEGFQLAPFIALAAMWIGGIMLGASEKRLGG
jgi:hypothetical protein